MAELLFSRLCDPVLREVVISLLGDLDAFYTDHRRCGDLCAGVEDREDGAVVWLECDCTARITRPVPPDD